MQTMKAVIAVALLSTPMFASASCVQTPEEGVGATSDNGGLASIVQHPTVDLCGEVRVGGARCHAKMRTDVTNNASPSGFGPSDLKSAYNLPASGGTGMTVAIVDANDDPSAESDVGVYRSQYGLPACTTANGCFKKVNQTGTQGSYPTADSGWAGEISLDLDMVSAICPSCKIVLVEANSATDADLGASVNTAASLGANVISNSYGGPEDSSVTSAASEYYNHPGILITASNGDDGYGAAFPASAASVLAVGGTSLVKSSSAARGWTETVWNDSGSGCSAYITKPSWQTDAKCSKRTIGDTAAIADPNTGVSVYDSYDGGGGWNVYGGTSVASPLVAAVFALTGKANATPQFPYANQADFYDVTSGSNGSCSGTYLCTGEVGYDGPTGNGTPNGESIVGAAGTDSGTATPMDASTPDSGSTPMDASAPDSSAPDSGSGASDAGGGGTNTCKHGLCTAGNKLKASCDPCAEEVCAQDSYCCRTLWDNICVSEVHSICGETCQ
jgi:hypothetical protein